MSCRSIPFNGWVAIDEFENLLADLAEGQIVSPLRREYFSDRFGKIHQYFWGPFHKSTDRKTAADLLLVVARSPDDLQMIRSIADARQRFRYIAAYVIDSYFTEGYKSPVKDYDHIFSTTQEGVDFIQGKFGVSSSVLRQGFDCLRWATSNSDRSIDLIGFGRQPSSFHREFQRSFHTDRSDLLYLHSPLGNLVGEAVWEERPMILKLLQRSKLSLAFHLLVEPIGMRPRDASFVTSRWFESLATGCVVVGKRPPGGMALELFPWRDALIELPDAPAKAVEVIKALALDKEFLQETRQRNVVEMCCRHDWRYRIQSIYRHFNLTEPTRLQASLADLEELVSRLKAGGMADDS